MRFPRFSCGAPPLAGWLGLLGWLAGGLAHAAAWLAGWRACAAAWRAVARLRDWVLIGLLVGWLACQAGWTSWWARYRSSKDKFGDYAAFKSTDSTLFCCAYSGLFGLQMQ